MSIDHDHDTGRFRGLLCRRCNTLLGMIENSAGADLRLVRGFFTRVIAYLS